MGFNRAMRTDTRSVASQHADVVALVARPTVVRVGRQARHQQATLRHNTPALHLSLIMPTITTKHRLCTLLLSQTRGTIIKATNKIKVISVVNSKVWNCSSLKALTKAESVCMTTHLLWVLRRGRMVGMELSDDQRRTKDGLENDESNNGVGIVSNELT